MLETPNYALLATNAYATSTAVVNPNNATPLPSGWSELAGYKRDIATTGFLANVYKNGSGDIVIAYAGTTDNSLDWMLGNVPAATGLTLAPQVTDAAKLYLDVLKANPTANITFIGHSLGGGLASLMSVFFDRQATTFDEAPFEQEIDPGPCNSNWTVTPGANPGDCTVLAPVVGETSSAGTDHVWAGEGDDYVDGSAGNNTIYGEGGSDSLFGDAVLARQTWSKSRRWRDGDIGCANVQWRVAA